MVQQFIQIEEDAKDFIKGKSGIVTVGTPNTGKLCCGKVCFSPDIRMTPPLDPENYHESFMDGINIYQHKDFQPSPGLSIGVASILGYKYLVINGWKLA